MHAAKEFNSAIWYGSFAAGFRRIGPITFVVTAMRCVHHPESMHEEAVISTRSGEKQIVTD